MVVIPAGVPRKPGMTRDDLFNTNASIVRDLCQAAAEVCPKAFVAIISNPVSGSTGDTARHRRRSRRDGIAWGFMYEVERCLGWFPTCAILERSRCAVLALSLVVLVLCQFSRNHMKFPLSAECHLFRLSIQSCYPHTTEVRPIAPLH